MPATLAPDRLARPTLVVAAYPHVAEIGIGGLLLALAEAAIAATIVVLAPRLLPGPGASAAPPEYSLARLGESATAFGASIETLDFAQKTIRDDPVAAAQLGQILRRRRPQNLITHPGNSPNPDYSAAHAIAWRAAVLAHSGGGLIAGAPLEKALTLWSFGDPDQKSPPVRFATAQYAERKYDLLSRLDRGGGPLPEPEQIARNQDLAESGPVERLFFVGKPR